MRKLMKLLIAVLMVVTCIPIMSDSIITAKADTDYYPMQHGCSGFEVDTVKDDGNFEYRGCYSNFDEAKNAMAQLGDDGVVRAADADNQTTLRHTRIVAMNKGIAYTCTLKNSTVSLNHVSVNGLTGYMNDYRETGYISTESSDLEGNGKVRINVGGFECTADLSVIELIPYKYVEKGIAMHIADDLYVTPRQASYTVVQNGNYRDLVYSAYSIFAKNGGYGSYDSMSITVGPAADWMVTGKTYYSRDDIHFYNDNRMTLSAGTYYNYYQFEPLRTKTSLSASDLNGFLSQNDRSGISVIANKGQAFIEAQNTYGMNAALIFAQACLESAYGTSLFARSRNNLFGWNAVDSNPDQADYFKSVDECINQHMGLNLRGYLYADDWRFFGGHFGNKASGITVKYASDSYYGLKISAIMYALDKYANDNNGNLTEWGSKKVGVINTYKAPVYLSAGSNPVYTTEYQPGYQDNNTVVILGEDDDYYKIQSDNILEDGKCKDVLYDNSVLSYDWNTNAGYMNKSVVTVIYNGRTSTSSEPVQPSDPGEVVNPEDLELLTTLTKMNYSEDYQYLHLEGMAFLEGMNATSDDDISHYVVAEDLENGSLKEFKAVTYKADSSLNFNDGYTYSMINYKIDIPMTEFADGNYALRIMVKNNGYSDYKYLVTKRLNALDNRYNSETGKLIKIYPNTRYSCRVEVTNEVDSLDYTSINKPTDRFSTRSARNVSFENNSLTIGGYAFIFKSEMSAAVNPDYKIILQNENGKIYSFDADNKASSLDYTSLLDYDFDLSYADYSVSIDLSQLRAGTYRMYIDIKNDNYHDIEELYNNKEVNMDYESNGMTYNLKTDSVRDRYILEVK